MSNIVEGRIVYELITPELPPSYRIDFKIDFRELYQFPFARIYVDQLIVGCGNALIRTLVLAKVGLNLG